MSPMDPRERRLVSIRRTVPAERRAEYDAAWGVLHTAATSRGAHAWRFRSADVADVYLEFLEFGSDSDLRADAETLDAIRALHASFGDPYPTPLTLEEWIEIPTARPTPP
ncbi:MAG TPA: hypothetical protein VHG28_10840 [Longimicrobiaceae bacterium]|nr:hypothetical protein [Longimicrobiaceae bacterium]